MVNQVTVASVNLILRNLNKNYFCRTYMKIAIYDL